jgi:hypothetical protein
LLLLVNCWCSPLPHTHVHPTDVVVVGFCVWVRQLLSTCLWAIRWRSIFREYLLFFYPALSVQLRKCLVWLAP